MADAIKDVKQAIGEMGMSAPLVKVGTTLAAGGRMVSDAVDRVRRAVTPAPKKIPRDINLPVERTPRRRAVARSRRMSR
jgi:hypothetical protein